MPRKPESNRIAEACFSFEQRTWAAQALEQFDPAIALIEEQIQEDETPESVAFFRAAITFLQARKAKMKESMQKTFAS